MGKEIDIRKTSLADENDRHAGKTGRARSTRLAMVITLLSIVAIAVVYFAGLGQAQSERSQGDGDGVTANAPSAAEDGKQIFRFDTFGDEAFWGDTLKLHLAIEGTKFGGVGPGVSPKTALAVGLKVDMDALPVDLVDQIKKGQVDLDDPATTLALIKLNSVLGIQGQFNQNGSLKTMGITCAVCHSTVDNAFAPGIGHRLDGWANRDLNVGAIISLAPDLSAVTSLLGVDEATVKTVLAAWGPGKFDAQLFLDGKGFRPDGKTAATLIPPAFGLAGVNLHTSTGWGGISHWNAFVANLEMHGKGNFYDPRLNDAVKFPIAARAGFANVRNNPDLISSKLPALQMYQLSILAPAPPDGSSTVPRRRAAKPYLAGRRTAPPVMCHRLSPNRAGTCTQPPKSALMISRPNARLTNATALRRSGAFGPTRPVVSITMVALRLCSTSSITTTTLADWV